MSNRSQDTPGVKIPPPLFPVGFLAIGIGVDAKLGGTFGSFLESAKIIGWVLVLTAIGINGWCFWMYWKNKTSILPHTKDNQLMTGGPFSFSRNPIYLCMVLLHVGFCALFDAPIGLIFSLLVILVLRYYVIAKEEAYLERRFGDAYLKYKKSVRRWI
jgi:protein-S-isoprenylcysteine O-methyltransferase Ste14